MKKLFSFVLSIVTALTAISLLSNTVSAPSDEDSDFVPVLRFVAMSDTHIKTMFDQRTRRIQRVLTMAYSDARQDPAYSKVDAALFVGDLTDKGTAGQYFGFKAAVNSVLRPETEFLAVVAAKSHDGHTFGKKALSFYENLTDKPADFHTIINGYHFIGISSSTVEGDLYSSYQRDWLSEQLKSAAADDPQKPIFVMHHEHVFDTVYGSSEIDGWGVDYFKDIFSEYPQIVHFSGHSHYPINDPRSIWQGDITAVGTGALYYAELTVDGQNCVHPENYKNIAQFWIVEVNAQNEVRMRGFDALAGEKLCEYTLHNVANAQARELTPDQQRAKAASPAFPAGTAADVRKTRKDYIVSVPAAESTDGSIVFLYRVFVIGTDGTQKSSDLLVNNYWQADDYTNITFHVQGDKGDTVQIVAENAYGMQSDPVRASLSD